MAVKDNSCGIADLQDKMLDILKEFDALCSKYGLRYWMAGGSLLGVMRHRGFIPWDDDLDVFMPRPDYEKLWSLIGRRKQDGHYVLCRTTAKKNYHHRVMQLVDVNTTFVHSRSKDEDVEHGLYIDIIPLDGCPDNKLQRLSQIVNAIVYSIYNIQCPPEYNGGKLTGIITLATKIMLAVVKDPKKRYRIWKRAEKKMTRYPWDSCRQVKSICAGFDVLIHPFEKEWFVGERKGPFEDFEVSIPAKTEEYLKTKYNDYMKVPPKEQQVVRHHTEFIDLNTPYTVYRGKYYLV